MVQKIEFDSGCAGVHLLVLAAIHGNETAGTNAVKRFLEEVKGGKYKLLRGRLTLVPVCNEQAYQKRVRQIEENLNRVMKMHDNPQTYEQKLANEIVPLIKDSDVMLDLHSTHCKGDVPFAFCDYPDEKNQQLIAGLPVNYVLEGWPDIYAGQSEIQDFSTEHAAHEFGHSGTTLECGFHGAKEAVDIAYETIINTLIAFGMVEGKKPEIRTKEHVVMDSFVIKEREGKLLKNYKHLDKVQKGEAIARYEDGTQLYAPCDGYILLPNLVAEIGAEWYYLGHQKL